MLVQPSLTWRLVKRTYPLSHAVGLRFQSPPLGGSSRHFTVSHGLLRKRGTKPRLVPSPEQQEVVKLCTVQNVVVSARPGSGKTATAEAIAAAYPNKRIAVLTYSKGLQLETHRRLSKYRNCEVFTFHAMAGLLFGVTVLNDAVLSKQRRRTLCFHEPPQGNFTPFDIIVLDEYQDCTELIFWLTNYFILVNKQKAGGKYARLVVLGDERQSIYGFRGADHRYLTLAPELLGPVSPYPFAKVALSESFRLSDQSVRFVNNVFLGGEAYMTSSKSGPKPIILRCYPLATRVLAKRISTLIDRYGAKNTVIIVPSYSVPIAVPIDDDAPLDDRVTDGKLCISTIHQFKGSERDLVILFGIDNSFFKYFGRDLPDDSCPNDVFVALTRALKQLVLVYDENKKLMPFVSVDALYETAEVINMTNNTAKISSPDAPGRPLEVGLTLPVLVGARDMTRHLQDKSLSDIIERDLRIRQLSPPLPEKDHIDIQDVVLSDSKAGFHEAVSDINGLAVVAAFEFDIAGTLDIFGLDKTIVDTVFPTSLQQQVPWLCQYACEYEARLSGYLPRAIQMKDHKFDWIKPEDLRLALNRLREELGNSAANLKFEVEAEQNFGVDEQETMILGRADVVAFPPASDGNNSEKIESIWEIKFVSQLSNEHIVQACVYTYLLAQESGKLPRTILYNVRDGEKLEIVPRNGREGLKRMIEDILRLKYTTKGEMTDSEFMEMCAKATQELLNLGKSWR